MVDWLRTSQSASANTIALQTKIPTLTRRFRCMLSMKANMMIAIAAPIMNAIYTRVSLKKTSASSYVFRYIRPNIAIVEVPIMAANRRYWRMTDLLFYVKIAISQNTSALATG